jgi:uncharacterized membrane protein
MLSRLVILWENTRDSLWGLPLAIALACSALAVLALGVDLPWVSEIAWLYAGGSQQAPEFASALVGAMITLTALAFSITMVVLALAAQQLGPRLIEIFMRDRGAQAALGLFLGTVIYLLLVLRALGGGEASKSPALAITGGTALVLASVVTLLFFVHSLASSIVADSVIARVGATLDTAICEVFPETTPPENDRAIPEGGASVRLRDRGYVQKIDHAALARSGRKSDAVIVLAHDVGAHVINGEVNAWVHARDDLTAAISSALVIGTRRSSSQDPEWSMRQLVEIALRALSPGVNDVFTALAVIDRLASSLAQLGERGDPRRVWLDEDGVPRVFGPGPTYEVMLSGALDQIREAGSGQGAVLRRLAENLRKLAAASGPRHAHALSRQIELLAVTAARLTDLAEQPAIEQALRSARTSLKSGAAVSPPAA